MKARNIKDNIEKYGKQSGEIKELKGTEDNIKGNIKSI